ERIGLIADDPLPFAELTGRMVRLSAVAAAYDAVSAFAILSCYHWDETRFELLRASLARKTRPLVVGNPDIVSPGLETMDGAPGYYAPPFAEALGISPIFLGKPFGPIYRRIAARHPDIAPERVLCVGDTLQTDILGGRSAGYRTLLIEDG